MLVINVQLGLTLCTLLPMLIVATVIFRPKSSRAYTEARERVSTVNADLQENVAGLRVAQAYRREQVNSDRFAGLSRRLPHVPAAGAAATSRSTSRSCKRCPRSAARWSCSPRPARSTTAR